MKDLVRSLPGRRLAVGAGGVLAFASLLAVSTRLGGLFKAPAVATAQVARGRFVRDVTATGVLKAVKATPILVPIDLQNTQKVAWLAKDGSVVRAGDPVIRFDPTDMEKELADGNSDRDTAQNKIAKTESENRKTAGDVVLDRDLAKEEISRAADFAPKNKEIFSRNEIIEAEIDRKLLGKRYEAAEGKLEASAKLGSTDLALQEGRFLDPEDEESFAQVCVIGSGVRRDLFGFAPAIGKVLKVNEVWLTVVGVLTSPASGERDFQGVKISGTANDIFLPVTTAGRKFQANPLKSPVDELIVGIRPGATVQEAAAVLDTLLERLHGGAADYGIIVPEALLDQSRKTQRLFNVVMGCIAGISLLVGGIGIMNIMLATVLERTREIGLRRAIGARRDDIRNQFIIESFTISVLGGLVGVAMGLVIAKGVAIYAGWDTVVTLFSILLSTGVSITVGLLFGIYPALRAADLDPIEALRYE